METFRSAKTGNSLVFPFLLALAIRLINFIGPVRGDDFRYLALAYDAQFGQIDTSVWSAADRVAIYMPISFLYRIFGANQWTSVAFPLVASLATVILIYFIGRHIKDGETGLIAALIWAVFPLDVVNATQVLPDSIVTAYAAGAVLFLLKGIEAKGWRRAVLWLGSALFSILAFFTKDIGVVNGLFCFGAMAFVLFRPSLEKFINWLGSRKSRVFGMLGLLVLAIILLIQFSEAIIVFPGDKGLPIFAQSATDFFEAVLLGVAPFGYEADVPGRIELFDLIGLFFLIALMGQALKRRKEILFPLIWVGFLFLASEWGTETLRLPFVYVPPDPELVLDRRHLLYMMLPVTLIVSSYLSAGLARHKWAKLVGLSLGLPLLAFLVRHELSELIAGFLVEKLYVLAILFALLMPLLLNRNEGKLSKGAVYFAGLVLLLVGLTLPMGRYHASDWEKERTLMSNLREAAQFLEQNKPAAPIITIPGNDQRLNYASDFELGMNWGSIDYVYSDARIANISINDESGIDYYIVFEDKGNSRHAELISPDWERLATFGEGSHSPITIYFSRTE